LLKYNTLSDVDITPFVVVIPGNSNLLNRFPDFEL